MKTNNEHHVLVHSTFVPFDEDITLDVSFFIGNV